MIHYYYVVALSILLLFHLFYLQMTSLNWDEIERKYLEHVELHLAQILSLLEAPDVRLLLKNPKSRQVLFLEFSSFVREDVLKLLSLRKLGGTAVVWVGLFFLCYYLMRLKARIFCSYNDLRFLSGLELVFVRIVK